jgi:uncharacterized protein (DUF1330 family)
MTNTNSLKRTLTDKISVEIVPADSQLAMDGQVWAINWFNYQARWLYNLYTLLAARFVVKVGGRLIFKGHHRQTLFGSEELARKTLLIVTYPQINNFLDMLTIKAFQLASLLRVRAVKDFVFGFIRSLGPNQAVSTNRNLTYIVCLYQGKLTAEDLSQLTQSHGIKVFFHGEKLARLKRIEQGKEAVMAPFFMDGLIVLEAENDEATVKFTAEDGFLQQNILQKLIFAAKFTGVK